VVKPTARNPPRQCASGATGEKQRELQREQDRKDDAKARQGGGGKEQKDKAVQADLRDEPELPTPAQETKRHVGKEGRRLPVDRRRREGLEVLPASRRALARLRLPRLARVFQLHHRHRAARDGERGELGERAQKVYNAACTPACRA